MNRPLVAFVTKLGNRAVANGVVAAGLANDTCPALVEVRDGDKVMAIVGVIGADISLACSPRPRHYRNTIYLSVGLSLNCSKTLRFYLKVRREKTNVRGKKVKGV